MSRKLNSVGKSNKKQDNQWINSDVKVSTGLPPQVDGQIRCFCKLTVAQLVWTIPKPPDLALVRVKWWGEEGTGIFFCPFDVKKGNKINCKTTARYPVRSGPMQFATYLTDMDKLTLDVMTSPNSDIIGQAHVNQIGLLSNTRPINGFFPVISATGQKLANLQVALVLEPLMVSYDDKGAVPTTDIGLETYKKDAHSVIVSDASYTTPHMDVPSRPVITLLKSPISEMKSHQSIPDGGTVAITTSGDVVHIPHQNTVSSSSSLPYQYNVNNSAMQRESPVKGGRDVLSVLVDKGNKLREAMIVSSMHTDLNAGHVTLPNSSGLISGHSNSGLATAILNEEHNGHSKSAIDLLMTSPVRNHDFQMYKIMNGLSPGTSMSSDMGYDLMMSETEDPLHENSILQDLFYYHSDTGELAMSDMSGFEHSPNHKLMNNYVSLPARLPGGSPLAMRYPLEEPGNHRPPSRASSLVTLNTLELKDDEPLKKKKDLSKQSKPKKKLMTRSRSSSRSRSRSQKRKTVAEEVSDSDQMSVVTSEATMSAEPKQAKIDGLSVERLTVLGRVHVARVNIDHLQLIKQDNLDTSDPKISVNKMAMGKPPKPMKPKKQSTYFVEYQFPVVASSRDKYNSSAMATEITRVASKNVKNGAILFNHRSVFPVLFNGASIERWWKSALVFRIYSKEAGEHVPTFIGSGGISLKSILRSENLFVQRDIEIPDTSKNGLLNLSRSSFNSSLNNRNTANLFGHLKVSVELASDHKEFATEMARTRLAEITGNAKIVPISGPNPEQVKALEQLTKNKDQPLVRVPAKQSFQDPTVAHPATPSVITGLPPQSPRRRNQVEDGDEISRLKQQLKATMAALENESHQERLGNIRSHPQPELDKLEPMTLHTMLFIQEGRQISMIGVPPIHMAKKHPALMKPQPEGRDSSIRNTYLVCRMFWCNDAVHSDVCWGTLNPEYNFLQVAPVLMTSQLMERLRNNFMIVEVWDKKVGSESDKLIGMVKLSLHQFFMSFRERKIANALLKSEYPVMAIDNYMPIVDPFSGLHFGQLKVVLAMGSEAQITTLQRLVIPSSVQSVPQRPSLYLERQDIMNGGDMVNVSNKAVDHQFEITIEGIRDLKLFENMMWGETDCFVQFFFPAQGEGTGDGVLTFKSMPTMKCYRTATTLCTPDPTFHDTSRHKITLPFGTPVQRELLTACANSGGGVTGLPFEVWCRYYHPNVRDQLIAKGLLPLAKLCAMITMLKTGEPCVQSFSLRLSQVGQDGQPDKMEVAAKSKSVGVLDVTINYKTFAAQSDSSPAVDRKFKGLQVYLSVGVIRASGLKAAADYMALIDPSMAYPADVGVNSYVRIKMSFLGKENERITKTVARSFVPEYSHYMDFPCPLLMTNTLDTDSTSLAELLETGEALFEVWHQIPTGINRDYQSDKSTNGLRQLVYKTGDILLGTAIVPLVSLLTRRTGVNGWFAINLPSLGWIKPVDEEGHPSTALDQVAGGLELSLRFANKEDRDHVVNAARSVGWSPVDVDVEQTDWQDEDSHHNVHNITVGVDQVSFPLASALLTGHSELDPTARCYIRYIFYDKGAVVSKCRKMTTSHSGTLLSTLDHKQSFMFPHSAPLQWYLREERLEIQAWVTYDKGRAREKKPRQRDKLIGCCYLDLESLTDLRRGQQRISGLYPLFKPGCNNLKSAFIRANITSRVSGSIKTISAEHKETNDDLDMSVSETDQSESGHDWMGDFTIDKSPKKNQSGSKDPAASFGVLLAVERAMHLPMVTEGNRSGEVCPTTYVSYQSAERSKPTCSPVFPNSSNPVWDYAVETRLSTEYLYKENKNLVLKVWHKPSDAAKSPDKSTDRVLGFVSIDLSPLNKGLHQICGWYNIIDFNGQCRGQIKVSITPQDHAGSGLAHNTPSTSFILPSFSLPTKSLTTGDVASSIAHQLMSLQQQVMQRMTSLTAASGSTQAIDNAEAIDEELPCTHHWQPQFTSETRTNDSSKSYLESSLKRQLQELDSITQRLKSRLINQSSDMDTSLQQMNSARSGDILMGTKSSLSTIHPLSSLSNTRESASHRTYDDVATSQESTHSQVLSNSSVMENATEAKSDDKNGGPGRKLLDSGIYSARNFSDKSGGDDVPDSHRSDKNVTTSDNMSTLHSGYNETIIPQDEANIGTLERGFLTNAVGKTQTLLPPMDNSESSGNSHGFMPGTNRSNATESFSIRVNEKASNVGSKSSSSPSKSKQSQSGSTTARSEQHEAVREEQEESDIEDEEEDELGGKYGSYHRYRELLDAEEEEEGESAQSDEEVDVVEVIPRSLNNMSTVLALNDKSGVKPDEAAVPRSDRMPASSPTVNAHDQNAHDGTSIWCSDDNDSFFQQVFEKNQHLLMNADGNVEDITIDGWLQERADLVGKARLESWLEATNQDRRKVSRKDSKEEDLETGSEDEELNPQAYNSKPIEDEEDMRLKLHDISLQDNEGMTSRVDTDRGNHVWQVEAGDSSDEETSRGMWVKKQSVEDFYADDYESKFNEPIGFQQREKVVQRKEENVLDPDEARVETSKNLLSVVEFTSTIASSAQSKTLQAGLTLHSTISSASAPTSQTLRSTFSEVSSLPLNSGATDEFPFTLELASTCPDTLEESPPSKVKHMLSNVELESNSSSPRPNSGASKSSAKSKLSHKSYTSKISSTSQGASLHSASSSGKSNSSSKSKGNSLQALDPPKENPDGNNIACQHSAKPELNGVQLGKLNGVSENANDSASTHDSAYTDHNSSNVTDSTVLTNGQHTEVSSTDQAKERMNGHHIVSDNQSLPNFFMPSEEMQASIKALQMATLAASKINQDDLRAENKAKAVSELVSKMTNSKMKAAPVSVKNKQPPSAEEAKRIAKIFSSKMH
nr:C2 domain-containing protein 3-like [Biomphalaria glabrata]